MRGKLSNVLNTEDTVLSRKMPWSFMLITVIEGGGKKQNNHGVTPEKD